MFYSTLCSISVTILAILITFISAYLIYSKQKQDELSINIQKQLQNLNMLFHKFSALEEYELPGRNIAGITNFIYIMQEEEWRESPDKIFVKDVNEINIEFNKVREQFKGQYPIATVFLPVKFRIRDFITKIYMELPSPPGIWNEDKVTSFEKFIRDDFPSCLSEFERWADKFIKYRSEVIRVYYRLNQIFSTIQKVQIKDIDKTIKFLEENDSNLSEWHVNTIRESISRQESSYGYYETFFLGLYSIGNRVQELNQNIKYYKNYKSRKLSYSGVVYILLASIFGVFLPLIKLSNFGQPTGCLFFDKHFQLFTVIGFFLFTILSFISFYTKFSTAITSP